VFCDIHHFRNHFNRRDLIVNNTTIINRTRVIKVFHRQTVDFDGRQRTIFSNKGPGVDRIERVTGAKFTPRPVRDVIRESHRPENLGRNQGQSQERRPDQQRGEEQRRATPAPTGREQQRNYQQQNNIQQPAQQNPDRSRQNEQRLQREQNIQQRPTPAPTGREQQRNYQQPAQQAPDRAKQPEQRLQSAPGVQLGNQPERKAPDATRRRDVMPPTGQQSPRVYPQTPKPDVSKPEIPKANPAQEQRKEVPTPRQAPVAPREKVLPPTGRDNVPRPEQRPVAPPTQAPAVKQAPATPATPDRGHGRDDDKDRNHP
jgi:hypothetical protein